MLSSDLKINYKTILFAKTLLLLILLSSNLLISENKVDISKYNKSIDSLKLLVSKLKDNDTSKVLAYHNLFKFTNSVNFAQQALEISKNLNFKRGLAISYLDVGKFQCFNDSSSNVTLTNLLNACKYSEETKDFNTLSSSYLYIGYLYNKDKPNKSKEYYEKCLDIALKNKDEINASYAYSALGNFCEFYDLNKKTSLEYYLKSYNIRKIKGDNKEKASSLNELSRLYLEIKEYEKANLLILEGLKIAEEENDLINISYFCDLIGNEFNRKNNFKAGLAYHLRSFQIAQQINKQDIDNIAKDIAITYYKLNDYKNASKYFLLFTQKFESVKKENSKNIFELSKTIDKFDSSISQLQKAEILKHKLELEKKVIFENSLVVGLILLFVVIVLVFIAYIQEKKQNEIKTQKLKIEEELKANETKFAFMIENISDILTLANKEGLILYESPSTKIILGYEQNELVGKNIFELIHPEDLDYVILEFQNAINILGYIDKKYQFRFKAKNNEYKYLESTVNNQIFNPEINAFIISSRDVTEWKKYEDQIITTNNEIALSYNKLSAYFNSTREAIYIFDSNFKIIAFNKIAENTCMKIFNKQVNINDDIYDYIPENSRPNFTMFSKKALDGDYTSYEVCLNVNNQDIWWEMSYFPVKDSKGYIIGVTLVSANINERKIAEIELISAKDKAEESERLKSSFLANMSHELRTPMNGILGFSEMLETEKDISQVNEFAKMINIGSQRLMETLNLILDISLIESGVNKVILENFDLIKELNQIINIHRANANIKNLFINVNSIYDKLNIHSSLKAIDSILNNLINNAIKFTKSGGITIDIEIEDETNVLINIIDTGIGIEEKYLDIIFEEFRQASEGLERQFEGTGLGLSLSKKFLELINGSISVESIVGEGSTFKIVFPYLKSTNEIEYENEKVKKQNKLMETEMDQSKSILMVEDDEVSALLAERVLKNKYKLDKAITSKEALLKVSQNHYDLIIMDINLGNGPNGMFTTKEIRLMEKYINTPIIAMSAYAMVGDREKFLESGCTDYISKPIYIRLFSEMINKYLS
ncbi:MAG: ATP-binding protein [Candidatus Kapabacteria bacterium]|nr:ATP-binding protein [Candidatus Kapabacteria bacterium]